MNWRLHHTIPVMLLCLGAGLPPDRALQAAEPTDSGAAASARPGYLLGGFRVLPELEVTGYHDDNIYATKRARESDLVTVVSPSINMESLWQRHSLDLGAGALIGRYLDNSDEDYEDAWFKGDGQIDLSDTTQIYAGAGYSYNHESRDSKEGSQQQIDEPTTYDARTLQVGIDQRFGKSLIKIGTTYEALDYDNVGSLYNDDRDRTVNGLGLRLTHPVSDLTQLYAQTILNQRRYEDALDQFGYDRDSDGYNALIGLTQEYPGGHRIEAYAGYLEQEYDDERFDRLREPNFGVDLRWYPTQKTQFTGKLERSINETTEVGSSGYLYTALDLQLDRKLGTDLLGYLNYNTGRAEFQDVGREDTTNTLSLGLKYFMSPQVMVTGSYSYVDNDSNDTNTVSPVTGTYDYERNLFFLTLRARLAP